MTERELNKRVEQILKSYDDVNRLFIRKVAENIKKIGQLNASSINRISIMASMNADINEITQAIAKAADLSTKELRALYEQALNDTYTDKRFQRALSREPIAPADRRRLEWYTQAATIQTAGALRNLSNTTIVSKVYHLLGKWRYSAASETPTEAASFAVVIRWLPSLDSSISARD